jgi:hypothetical protein
MLANFAGNVGSSLRRSLATSMVATGSRTAATHNVKPWPHRLIVVALLMGASALPTTAAAEIASLLGTPPIAIDIRAEPIAAFPDLILPRIRRSVGHSHGCRWRALHFTQRPWTVVHGAPHL